MDVPTVRACCGMFPPKHATYLISLFGLAIGGITLAGIIIFGLVEKGLLNYLNGQYEMRIDENVKKAALLTIGLISLLLTSASVLLFIGSTASNKSMIGLGVWVLFALCMILITSLVLAPISCFFLPDTCIVKKTSTTAVFFFGIGIGGFLMLWLYFIVVAYNSVTQI